jgi:hypothetical protein
MSTMIVMRNMAMSMVAKMLEISSGTTTKHSSRETRVTTRTNTTMVRNMITMEGNSIQQPIKMIVPIINKM